MNKKKRVIINTIPKSGTNFVAEILRQQGYKDAKKSINSNMYIGDHESYQKNRKNCVPEKQGIKIGCFFPIEVSRVCIDVQLSYLKKGMYLKSHGSFQLVNYLARFNTFDVITVVRNPLAIVNSQFHYIKDNPQHFYHDSFMDMPSDEIRWKVLIGGGLSIDKERMYSYTPMKVVLAEQDIWTSFEEVTVVHYEDLWKGDYSGLSEFIDPETVDPDTLRKGPTFRKGEPDSWMDEIPEEIQVELKELLM